MKQWGLLLREMEQMSTFGSGSGSGSAQSQTIALWPTEREEAFIDICLEFLEHRATGVHAFYGMVAHALDLRFHLGYTGVQMKNKWDNLKCSFNDWNTLLQIPGGTWNLEYDRLDGEDSWWDSAAVRRYRRFKRNPPTKFREQNQLFNGCIGTPACMYEIPPIAPPPPPRSAAPARSFTRADAAYYSDWMSVGNPPRAAGPSSRRRHTEHSSLSQDTLLTPRFLAAVDRTYRILSAISEVEQWEIMQIFRNHPGNVDIVEALDERGICGFIGSELQDLPHRRRRQ